MKYLTLALASFMALVPAVTAQYCQAFVPVNNSTDLSEDYTKVVIQLKCPDTKKIPGQMHYHVVTSEQTTGIPALTATASQADLIVAALTPEGMSVAFSDEWDAAASDVGAELTFRSGNLKHLVLEGYKDHVFIDDKAGSLQVIDDTAVNAWMRIQSTSTGTIKYTHKGTGGSVLIDAPNATLDVEIYGVEHDIRVKCKAISGTIAGTGDKLVVVSGEVTSLKMSGINIDVELHETQSSGGCGKVLKEGIGNECKSNSQVTFEIESMECVGTPNKFQECSGAVRNGVMGLLIALGAYVAVVVGNGI